MKRGAGGLGYLVRGEGEGGGSPPLSLDDNSKFYLANSQTHSRSNVYVVNKVTVIFCWCKICAMTTLSTKVDFSWAKILEAQKCNVHRGLLKTTAIRINKTIFYSTLKISEIFSLNWRGGLGPVTPSPYKLLYLATTRLRPTNPVLLLRFQGC